MRLPVVQQSYFDGLVVTASAVKPLKRLLRAIRQLTSIDLLGYCTVSRQKVIMNNLKFDERGLIPAIVQDLKTMNVLMMAWMNDEALRLTQSTSEVHFWSRSRQELWHKGATSGNTMHVHDIYYDCDEDALLVIVEPTGPACHTGAASCFHRQLAVGSSVDGA